MPPLIIVHVVFAVFSLLFGYYTFLTGVLNVQKVNVMALVLTVVAVTGLSIQTSGSISYLHIFSIVTLVSVILFAFKRGPLLIRSRNIVGPYIGLIFAFAFTLLPTRLMGGELADLFGSDRYAYAVCLGLLVTVSIVSGRLVKKYFVSL